MFSIAEVYLNRIVLITLIFMLVYLSILKVNSCIKKIANDMKTIRREHHHPFYKKDDDYLAE